MADKVLREIRRIRFQLAARGIGDAVAAAEQWLPYDLQRTLAYTLGARLVSRPQIRVRYTDSIPYGRDCVMRREGGAFEILLARHASQTTYIMAADYGPSYLWWLLNCADEVRELSVTISDGDYATGARFAPSTNRSDVVAIPDPYFCTHRAFGQWRELADTQDVPWNRRSADILWVGAASGNGTFDPVLGAMHPQRAAPRLRLCMALKDIDACSGRIYFLPTEEATLDVLHRHGYATERVPEESWLTRKFAIDMDGQTNTWSNLLVRFHLGCCVLKVESEFGYRQWYYDRIRPWEHFIPVRSDLSDLAEKIEWARSHDARSRQIAENGRAFARTLTYEAGLADAVRLITENWKPYEAFAIPER
jgi:hypothetical protein